MKRTNNIVKSVTLISLAVSLVAFGIAAVGSVIESSMLMMFWYIGLIGVWVIMAASIVASLAFLFDHGHKWIQKHFQRTGEHHHYPPHAAI